MIEILKLDTETDVSVLSLLSCSASCLMGKVTASVSYSHSTSLVIVINNIDDHLHTPNPIMVYFVTLFGPGFAGVNCLFR